MTDSEQMAISDEKDVPRGVLAALDPFRKLRETMPLQYVRAFILVATEEGLSVGEYARRARIAPALMTGHLADLGTTNRYHEAGFGLVKQFYDAMDKRVRLIRLSAAGKRIVGVMVRAAGRGLGINQMQPRSGAPFAR